MRFPHTLRFTRADGSTFRVQGYAELVDDSGFTTEGVRPQPSVFAIANPSGYGTRWTIAEGDRMEVDGIRGVVSQVRPVLSANRPGIHHVEIRAG